MLSESSTGPITVTWSPSCNSSMLTSAILFIVVSRVMVARVSPCDVLTVILSPSMFSTVPETELRPPKLCVEPSPWENPPAPALKLTFLSDQPAISPSRVGNSAKAQAVNSSEVQGKAAEVPARKAS